MLGYSAPVVDPSPAFVLGGVCSETGRWAVTVGNAPQTCSRFTETFPPPLHFLVFLVYFMFVFVICYFLGLGLG